MQAKTLIYILWPSFLVAGVAEALFFTVFDPKELTFFGETVELGRTAIYSIGFFLFWAFGAASSTLTWFLQRSSPEVNKGPFTADEHHIG